MVLVWVPWEEKEFSPTEQPTKYPLGQEKYFLIRYKHARASLLRFFILSSYPTISKCTSLHSLLSLGSQLLRTHTFSSNFPVLVVLSQRMTSRSTVVCSTSFHEPAGHHITRFIDGFTSVKEPRIQFPLTGGVIKLNSEHPKWTGNKYYPCHRPN